MANPEMSVGEEGVAFYYFVGLAATQWAHVENGLYNLALTSLGQETRKTLGPSFYSIANFRSKLGFTDKAFAASADFEAFAQEWAELYGKIKKWSSKRNEIAHGSVMVYPEAPEGRRYAILPFGGTQSKFRSRIPQPPSDALCVRELDLAARQFARAANHLLGLCARVQGHEDPFGARVQQELQARPLAQLAHQIHVMPPQRDGSSPP